jgi:predicted O-linked N-acetylglucosamine transferase (SPINDLY family)
LRRAIVSIPSPAASASGASHPHDVLRAAWDAFARGDMNAAAASFATAFTAADDDKAIAAEAAFGLAHVFAAENLPDRSVNALDHALTLALGDGQIQDTLVAAWRPLIFLKRGIHPVKVGLNRIPKKSFADRMTRLRLLAALYERANDAAAAITALNTVISFPPRDAPTLARIGFLWLRAGDQRMAVNFFKKALALEPHHLPAMDGIATACWIDGDVDTARAMLAERARLTTDAVAQAVVRFKSAVIQPAIAMDDDEIDTLRARFAAAVEAGPAVAIPDPWRMELGPNFYANYHARPDRALHEAVARYFLKATPSLAETGAAVRRSGGARIRVGMVSNYFSAHTVGYLNHGLIRGLDRSRFEVVLFRTPHAYSDEITQAMTATAALIDLPPDLAAARRVIADARLDILHYPEIGMDHFTYFLAYARLAPLQTVGWGHPITTGLPSIDLFLSQDDMEPANAAAHYTERLVRLRNLSIDVAPPRVPDASVAPGDLGLKAGAPAYVCAQSLYKLHHHFDETLALILERDADGLLYFLSHSPHADARFRERLERRIGRHIARVHILPRVTRADFLRLVRAADVLLDVPQWSGGKTSLEGFAMGTPIVHWPGEFMRGRHTLAFLCRMGITATVVDSPTMYAETAVRLVHDTAVRGDARNQIAANSHRLFNDTASIREIEDVWVKALEERT